MSPAPPPAAAAFLRRSMVARLATLSANGVPLLTPIWFVEDGGRLYMTARRDSPAGRHVAANPEVVLLFRNEGRPGSGRILRVRGRAVLREQLRVPILLRFALKYHLSPGGLRNFALNPRTLGTRVRYYAERAGEGGTVEVVPETFELLARPDA